MPRIPRISFGLIVLNGEPFTTYCLRSIYPFAHEIIVVEGAVRAAAAVATQGGHSTDGTLESLHRFKEREDPNHKLTIVTREGYWNEKDEMSQAYAQRATGDYLWQVDVDEFYRPKDMQSVLEMLTADPTIAAVSFKQLQFWGGFDYVVDGWFLKTGPEQVHRIFRWGPGYTYAIHRPPTVRDADGFDVRRGTCVMGYTLARRKIYLYHYSLVFPSQTIEKSRYYGEAQWAARVKSFEWAQEVFLDLKRPFRAHNVYQYPGWLERFQGSHPRQIEALRADLREGRVRIATRPTEDIERLLASRRYALGRSVLKLSTPLAWFIRLWLVITKAGRGLLNDPANTWRSITERIRSLA